MPVSTYKKPISSNLEELRDSRDSIKKTPANYAEKELIKKFGNPDSKRERLKEPIKSKRFGNPDPDLKSDLKRSYR